MKTQIYALMALMLSISLLSPQLSAESGIKMHRIQVQQKNHNGWYPAISTKGMFSVLLPIPFNDFTIFGDKTSETLHAESVGGKSSEGVKFSATRIYYTKPSFAEIYFMKFENGKAFPGSNVRRFRFNEYRAIDLVVSNSDYGTMQRAVLANGTLILLIIEWPKQHEHLVKSITFQFLDSLEIRG